MQPDQKEEKKKRVYEKPRLRTIELAAEEVLGTGCKQATLGFAYGQDFCGLINNCNLAGS
jgi:hypothetical protein